MNTLWDRIQNELGKAFQLQNKNALNLSSLVINLKQCYILQSRHSRGDNLVPFSSCCLLDNPVRINKISQYELVYRWNIGKDSEFVNETISKGIIIPEGTVLDRVGPERGRYLCPIPENRDVYTVEERALPYYLPEQIITSEPAYHKYRVKKDISKEAVLQAIEDSVDIFENESAKKTAIEKVKSDDISCGKVAPVTAFCEQGSGNGYQYKVLVSVYYLRALGFVEEAN